MDGSSTTPASQKRFTTEILTFDKPHIVEEFLQLHVFAIQQQKCGVIQSSHYQLLWKFYMLGCRLTTFLYSNLKDTATVTRKTESVTQRGLQLIYEELS